MIHRRVPRFWHVFGARCVVGMLILIPGLSRAFDDQITHPRLTERSASSSRLSEVLKEDLAVTDGIQATLRPATGPPQRILDFLRDGSRLEDDPVCRASNHFHNPLRPFTASGVTDLPWWVRARCAFSEYSEVRSNVTWGTRFTSPTTKGPSTGNTFDWDAARSRYLEALTLRLPTDREAALVNTFQALGNALHLVQDLAVPAHVRSDFMSHLQYCAPEGSDVTRWCSNTFERYVRLHPESIDSAKVEPVAFASQPVTRFWDLDRYVGNNPSGDALQGLAEYTNANFPSQNTIFTESLPPTDSYRFPYPQEASTDLADLLAQRKLFRSVPAEDGVLDANLYLAKTQHGETLTTFLKPGYLTDYVQSILSLRPYLRLTFHIDETAMGEYASKLVPRAVNYSAGLLDYFFRGKLDVDLLGPDSLGTYQLTGTNQSTEPLAGGTLTLYADVYNDPAAPDPQTPLRKPIPGATSLTVGTVDPEKPLLDSPASFPAPDAERYVAVYTGGLGQEQAQGDSPGAVIGKVLGGVRVEEVFADDAGRWKLRTPTGIFPLSQVVGGSPEAPVLQDLTTDTFEWLWWGDAENLLVGLTKYPENPPIRVVAFEVPRQATSVEPRTVATPDGPVLPVTVKLSSEFPFDLPLGTQVTLTQKVHYRQPLVKVEDIWKYTWHAPTVDANGNPIPGSYFYDSEEYTLPQIDTPVNDTMTFGRTFDLTLDFPHGPWGSDDNTSPYYWVLEDIGVDATGTRLLALVWAMPDTFDYPPQTRPNYVLNSTGGLQQDGTVSFTPQASQEIWIWALIDVTNRRVLATTSPAQVTYTSEERQDGVPGPVPSLAGCWDGIGYWQRRVDRYIGGPNPHDEPHVWGALPMAAKGCHHDLNTVPVTATRTDVLIRQGTSQAHLTWLRQPLADAFEDPTQLDFTIETHRGGGGEYLYGCGVGYCTLALPLDSASVLYYPVELVYGRRARPAPAAGERLVLLPSRGSAEYVPLLVLTPGATPEELRVAVPFQFPAREWSFPFVDATGDGVLLTGEYHDYWNGIDLLNGYVVALDGATPPLTVPGVDFRSNFVLLAPRFVYNTEAQRFFRVTPPLGLTALPRRLWALEGNPSGDYHIVRLP